MNHPRKQPDVFRLAPGALARARTLFLVLGSAGVVLSAVGFAVDRRQFFYSYLTAYAFVLTVCLGCLFFVMLQHLTRAGWSVTVRRLAEVAAGGIPIMALLFLPILAGMKELYPWTHPDLVAGDAALRAKHLFLNVPFFVIRAVIYFSVWWLLARYFLRTAVSQDQSRDFAPTVSMQRRAAPGIVLFALTLTLMSIDWFMSLDPHWYSTIFGVYVFAGTAWSSFAFLALVALGLRRAGYLGRAVRTDHYQDLGRLLFAFAVFWAYIAFSQYFLIWYGNVPEETEWYVHRIAGSWRGVSFFLAAGHFGVPFVLLMSRWLKRRPVLIGILAAWCLFMHFVDIHWIVMPSLHHEGLRLHWLDLAALAAVGGIFLYGYVRALPAQDLVPAGDPRLPESLALEHLY